MAPSWTDICKSGQCSLVANKQVITTDPLILCDAHSDSTTLSRDEHCTGYAKAAGSGAASTAMAGPFFYIKKINSKKVNLKTLP